MLEILVQHLIHLLPHHIVFADVWWQCWTDSIGIRHCTYHYFMPTW